MKCNIGDKVKIVDEGTWQMRKDMYEYLGTIMTIKEIDEDRKCYKMFEDDGAYLWTDNMIEDKVTPHSNVNHPKHYNHGKYEVIDVIEDWKLNYHLGNAIKYIARCEHKNNKVEDLKKAIWYLKREIKNTKGD